MKIIVGLGNPGEKYKETRHNTGWFVLDQLNKKQKTKNKKQILKIKNKIQAETWKRGVQGEKILLVKSLTFMNNSGQIVKKLIENCKLKIENLIVIHDDLDIPLGKYKIQFGKGPREHRGVESVERALGTKDFWRVRIGIENRGEKLSNLEMKKLRGRLRKRISGEEYVLQEFSEEERKIIDQVILEVVDEIKQRLNLF